MEVRPLNWGSLADVAISGTGQPLIVLLDRVTDPHNAGAVLRSAEVFGARAVIAPKHHSAPETGALAKTASGALERQPYLRVTNLADAMQELRDAGYLLIGLEGEAALSLSEAVAQAVSDLKASEPARAFAVWRKKFGTPASTPAERAKQVRFLASRGFGGEAIARVVSGAFDADEV